MMAASSETIVQGSKQSTRARLFSGMWKFANSAFFLFLLSTVAITWATKLYTDYQAKENLRSERRLQAIRIVSEISLRSIRLSSLELRREQLLEIVDSDSAQADIETVRTKRSKWMDQARAIIRGGGEQGNAASEFSGTHLSILLRQNDLLTGWDSQSLPVIAAWVESEKLPLMLITRDLESYVNLQDAGLRDGILPLLPGDDKNRQAFENMVKRRKDVIPAQVKAALKRSQETLRETKDDIELETKIEIDRALDDLSIEFNR